MNIHRLDLERFAEKREVTQTLGSVAKLATAEMRRRVVGCRAMTANAVRKCTNMNPFLVDDD
jgi:hypothetical protein